VSGELWAKSPDGSAKKSAAIAPTIKPLRVLLRSLLNIVAFSWCFAELHDYFFLKLNCV
jgi:hypothetical protein